MRKFVAALILVAGASVSLAQVPSRSAGELPEARKFSVVIERSGFEWRARCDMGCAWVGMTGGFSCKENCDAILDANGLVTTKTERDLKVPFSFVLSADGDGSIVAKSRAGTHWQQLGWNCHRDPCTVRVTEFGVSTDVKALGGHPGK